MSFAIQQFPCSRTLADFALEGPDFENAALEKTARIATAFFLTVPAILADLLLSLPLAAYNASLSTDTSLPEIEVPSNQLTSRPIDNSSHLRQSVDLALDTWSEKQADFREALVDGMVDEWNVFQMAAEWSIVQYLENSLTNRFVPSYLAGRPALADGTTIESLAPAFKALSPSDRRDLLKHIREQKENEPSSRFEVQALVRSIRALASELQQGNRPFIEAIQNYKYVPPTTAPRVIPFIPWGPESYLPYTTSSELEQSSIPARRVPTYTPSAPPLNSSEIRPIQRPTYRPSAPAYEPARTPSNEFRGTGYAPHARYPSLVPPTHARPSAPAAPSRPVRPSAPVAPNHPVRESADVRLALDVGFVRNALKQATRSMGANQTEFLRTVFWQPERGSTQNLRRATANLTLLHFLSQYFQARNHRTPDFIALDKHIAGTRSLRDLAQNFMNKPAHEIEALEKAFLGPISPARVRTNFDQQLYRDIDKHAELLIRDREFLKVFDSIKIDLMAD